MDLEVFALDIGGAFIKSTHINGNKKPKRSIIPFEMWKNPKGLEKALNSLKPKSKNLSTAITMTGELCDCFKNRAEGVRHIVKSANSAFGTEINIFARKGKLLSTREAIKSWREVASANWAITPLLLARQHKNFVHVDIGSTTTDITPVRNGKIVSSGWDDFSRLANGELVYTGFLRTPVGATVREISLRKKKVALSAETFAIMADVYLILGSINSRKYNCPTPDGKAKTRTVSLSRLARMVLSDRGDLTDSEIANMAKQIALAQREHTERAVRRLRLKVISTGTGAFLLDPAFKSNRLKRFEKAGGGSVKNLDPSLSLALLVKNGAI